MTRCFGEWEGLWGTALGLGIMAIELECVRGGDGVGELDDDRRGWLGAGNSMWGRARTVSCDEAIGSSSSSSSTASSRLASNGSTRIGDGGLEGGGTSTSRNRRASASVTGPFPLSLPTISILFPTTTQQ